jgi:hypothetical protein
VVLKDADLPLKRHGTVCLTPAGPVLLYQIGDRAEETRMLVDVKGKLPSVADGSLKVGWVTGHSSPVLWWRGTWSCPRAPDTEPVLRFGGLESLGIWGIWRIWAFLCYRVRVQSESK